MEYLRTFLEKARNLLTHSSHPHPVRDWFLIVGVAAVCVGSSVGWNVWNFFSTQRLLEQVVSVPPQHGFNRNVVDDMEKAFAERIREAEKYQASYHFVDPSR